MTDPAAKFAERSVVGFTDRSAAFRASKVSLARLHRCAPFRVLWCDGLSGQGAEQGGHLGQRNCMIDRHVFKRIARHVRKQGIGWFLHDGHAATLLDFPKAGSAVVESAGEDHADNSWPIGQRCGAKQDIHGGAMPVFPGTRTELDLSVIDEQLLGWRRYINMTGLDRSAVRTIACRHRSA